MSDAPRLVELTDDAIESLRVDSYFSDYTGLGGSKDRTSSIDFKHTARFVSGHHVNQLYAGDPLAARIVDLPVNDSLRAGWDIVFSAVSDDGDIAPLDPKAAAEIQAKITTWEKRVGLHSQIEHWWKRGRAHGGALLVLGVDDGVADKAEPLRDGGSFDWLRVFTRWDTTPSVQIGTDSKDPSTFCLPERYQIHPSGLGDPLANVQVHASRVWRYGGVQVDDPIAATSTGRSDTFGDSVFERVWPALKHWNSALQGAGHLIQDFAQAVYAIKGFRQVLRAKGGQGILFDQFAVMETFRSMFNATVVDAEDSYERKTTSVAGMPDLIDRFGYQLASASGMPLTLLLGLSPGGFGTGETEGTNWDNVVSGMQQNDLLPALERVYSVLFATDEFRGIVPDSWSIVFRPLAQRSDKDQAEIQARQAQTDALYLQSGVLTADEVAQSRFGSEGFSLSTTIDQTGRADFDAASDGDPSELAPAGVPVVAAGDVAKTAMNGAQIASLVDVVSKVAMKQIPPASAIAILRVAFQISESEARAIIGDAVSFTPAIEPTNGTARNTFNGQ